MSNILEIEINIISMTQNINILIDVKNMLVNNTFKIEKETIDCLLNTICLWKNEYGIKGIDLEEFKVRVVTDTKTDVFHGKGIYPKNYQCFKEIVGELYGY